MAEHAPAGAECLYDQQVVAGALDRLAARLQPQIDQGNCVLLAVLMGGMFPTVWLAQRLAGDFLVDYCHVTRYRGAQKGGQPEWLRPPAHDLRGRHVIIIDDIFDEGVTLDWVRRGCNERGAGGVSTVTLVRKCHQRATAQAPDLHGLEVPDLYVFGCGMDYEHGWRHLRGIYAFAAAPGERRA